MRTDYVHGYDAVEGVRLDDQASALEALLHGDTAYPPGAAVLEAGCGVGAQTAALLRGSPHARFTCVDISAASLAQAAARLRRAGGPTPDFRQADLYTLPFSDGTFEHVFVCFVLEHLARPASALAELRRVLRPGGSLTVIEGDHGSALFHPDANAARDAIRCLESLQRAAGGDPDIGRRLFPLLSTAGFHGVHVSPRQIYIDAARPDLADGFIRRTFAPMVAGVRDEAIRTGLTKSAAFDAGVQALLRTAEPDGVFCYTFFKATCVKA